MSVHILEDKKQGACLFDSVSGLAFGPVVENAREAERLLASLEKDARLYTTSELALRAAQLAQEVL